MVPPGPSLSWYLPAWLERRSPRLSLCCEAASEVRSRSCLTAVTAGWYPSTLFAGSFAPIRACVVKPAAQLGYIAWPHPPLFGFCSIPYGQVGEMSMRLSRERRCSPREAVRQSRHCLGRHIGQSAVIPACALRAAVKSLPKRGSPIVKEYGFGIVGLVGKRDEQ
jgi:hypothetical protein